MENSNNNLSNNSSSRMFSGLIIVLIGIAFLINTLNLDLPRWIFSWSNLLILVGIFIGLRNNFKGIAWLILILIGAYNTIENMHLDFDISKYALGFGFVILGAYLIFKPKGALKVKRKNRYADGFNPAAPNETLNINDSLNSNDFVEATAVFGGSNQIVYSKNLKGGDVTVVFGGADLNFIQADFTESIALDVTAVFGGIKLVVPQNWIIKSNVTPIFGSVEDKRGHLIPTGEVQKTLVIDGTVMFGGIEIKSF
ncbi:hypothetical protein ACFOWA_03865 [Pedobacter lithocola]|uniref:LiaF transmembrane domain-containing protein n=1 Tax=Pedobacter lithocola TaxID=1908239 RepID=A0ABV8P5Y0_9SPHI